MAELFTSLEIGAHALKTSFEHTTMLAISSGALHCPGSDQLSMKSRSAGIDRAV